MNLDNYCPQKSLKVTNFTVFHQLYIEDTPFFIRKHILELPGNYPVFTVVMVNLPLHLDDRGIIVTPNFLYNIYENEKYIIQEKQSIYTYNH